MEMGISRLGNGILAYFRPTCYQNQLGKLWQIVFSRWLHHSVSYHMPMHVLSPCNMTLTLLHWDIGFIFLPLEHTQTFVIALTYRMPQKLRLLRLCHKFPPESPFLPWDTCLESPGLTCKKSNYLRPACCSSHMERLHRDGERYLRSPISSYLSLPRLGTGHEWRNLEMASAKDTVLLQPHERPQARITQMSCTWILDRSNCKRS